MIKSESAAKLFYGSFDFLNDNVYFNLEFSLSLAHSPSFPQAIREWFWQQWLLHIKRRGTELDSTDFLWIAIKVFHLKFRNDFFPSSCCFLVARRLMGKRRELWIVNASLGLKRNLIEEFTAINEQFFD